jgi:hypothetical protein
MKTLLTGFIFLISICCLHAQDSLFRKDGTLLLGKIISTGDTVQYTDINGAKGSIQWVRMVDLSAIHFANGKRLYLGKDSRQDLGKIFIKFGGVGSSERRSTVPGFDAAYSIFGTMLTVGAETKKFGKRQRLSIDIEGGYLLKGGFAPQPNVLHDNNGAITYFYDPSYGERLRSLEFFSVIKYHISKGFYIKGGIGINRMISYKVMADSYLTNDPIAVPLTSGLDEYYIKTTCGIVYGIGFVTLPKRVGFLFELSGMNDLSPIGVTTTYHPKYFGNSMTMNVGMFVNLYKEKK